MISPVLFIIFKREDTTRRVFERIREAQPPRLYIAADGPRPDRPDEKEKCEATRKVVENIDWPCEVHHLFRDENLGCGKGVSSAITWFFEHEEQGIIIEDDILPHIDFFKYCDEMLERFKDDERIQIIAGNNYFYDGYQSDVSYYMSAYMNIWGWASWRRVWKTYDFDVNELDENQVRLKLFERLHPRSAKYFWHTYKRMKDFQVDTWDYQFFLNQQYYDRYSIAPFVNMIKNIGIGGIEATHTIADNPKMSNQITNSPYPIVHPSILKTDRKADYVSMKNTHQYSASILERIILKIKKIVRGAFRYNP